MARVAVAFGVLTLVASVTDGAGVPAASSAAVRLAPSGFVVEPRLSDPLCNGGKGVRLPARFGGIPIVATATLNDGSSLIAISDYGPKRSVELRSVTRRCAPNAAFGRQGTATIAISLPRERPKSIGTPSGLWVLAVAARSGGGAIVGGGFGNH